LKLKAKGKEIGPPGAIAVYTNADSVSGLHIAFCIEDGKRV
jgi:hypothetical protein